MVGGMQAEAVAEANRGYQLDPLSPTITMNAGYVLAMAGRYEDGFTICSKVTQESPSFARAHYCLPYIYRAKGNYAKYVDEEKLYGRLSGSSDNIALADALAEGFHAGGWKSAGEKGIAELLKQRKTGYASPFEIAAYYAELGDKDRAFTWLDTAYEERAFEMESLKTHFALSSLRSDPRFAELVRKVGLP